MYSKDDLQRILKAILKAQAPPPTPTPTPALAFTVFKVPQDNLKVLSLDIYHQKSHIDCDNFYQQYKNSFALVGTIRPTQILFATSFLWHQISFRWQQYNRKRDVDSSILVILDKFKAFLRRNLGDSQVFINTY